MEDSSGGGGGGYNVVLKGNRTDQSTPTKYKGGTLQKAFLTDPTNIARK